MSDRNLTISELQQHDVGFRSLNVDVTELSHNDDKFSVDGDERLSLDAPTTLSHERFMGISEERPNSSSSSVNTSKSKIPRFTRSASLRERKQRHSFDDGTCRNKSTKAEFQKTAKKDVPNIGGLYRSASFATSRGFAGLTSSGGYGRTSPLLNKKSSTTPEFPRKRFSLENYSSPYSKKVILAERKQLSLTEHNLESTYTKRKTDAADDVNESEKSYGSDGSAALSCDGPAAHYIRSSMWGHKRSTNILHCRHLNEPDPDEYLTPTQRAARKIREMKAQLRESRLEIAEKDAKIVSLTRELIELKINKSEGDEADTLFEDSSKRLTPPDSCRRTSPFAKTPDDLFSQKLTRKEQRTDAMIPSYQESQVQDSNCVTPPSDVSEQELHLLRDSVGKDSSSTKEGISISSPSGISLEESESGELNQSLADSGHYDDVPSPCLSSKGSLYHGRTAVRRLVRNLCTEEDSAENSVIWSAIDAAERRVKVEYDRRFEELQRNQMNEYHELKERHNDHVENLLSKLSETNLRYFELRPLYDKAQERIKELEKESSKLKEDLHESEIRHQKIYLQMYLKGQQAAKIEAEEEQSIAQLEGPLSVGTKCLQLSSVDKADNGMVLTLMRQLSETEEEILKLKALHQQEITRAKKRSGLSHRKHEEIDPEITLQFLKSAVYYYLTDKDNCQGHLRAIESILGYSAVERQNISKHVHG